MNRGTIQYLVLMLFLLVGFGVGKAQDPQYTQFYANQPLLNPAFTGSAVGPRVSLNYRAQWVAIPGSFRQNAISYDQPIGASSHGLGGIIHSDRAGEGNLSKTFVNVNYSYAINFGRRGHEKTIRLGLGGGLEHTSIDFNNLRFSDQIDQREGFIYATQEAPPGFGPPAFDAHFGAAYYNQHAWLGFSVHHLTEPTQSRLSGVRTADNTLPRKYTFTGGVRIPVGPMNDPEQVTISPAFVFMNQRNFNQMNFGTYVSIEPMVFGVWWRSNFNNFNGDLVSSDALAGLIGFKEGIFSVGYSYDYTVSQLTNGISGGSHEIAVIMEFEQNPRRRRLKHRNLPCPRF